MASMLGDPPVQRTHGSRWHDHWKDLSFSEDQGEFHFVGLGRVGVMEPKKFLPLMAICPTAH